MSRRGFYSCATPERIRKDRQRQWSTLTGVDWGAQIPLDVIVDRHQTVDEDGTICYHFFVPPAHLPEQVQVTIDEYNRVFCRSPLGAPFVPPKPDGEP